jgi:hypothetical protein
MGVDIHVIYLSPPSVKLRLLPEPSMKERRFFMIPFLLVIKGIPSPTNQKFNSIGNVIYLSLPSVKLRLRSL